MFWRSGTRTLKTHSNCWSWFWWLINWRVYCRAPGLVYSHPFEKIIGSIIPLSVYLIGGYNVSKIVVIHDIHMKKSFMHISPINIYPSSKVIPQDLRLTKKMRYIACMDFILRSSFTQPKIDKVNAFSPVLAWLIWCLTDQRQAVTLLTIRQTSTDQQGLDTSHLWIDYHLSFIILSALLLAWLLRIKIWGLKSSPIASPLIVGNRSN